MRIALGRFARSGIETRLGGDVATGVELALHHYTRRLRSARRPIDPPHFRTSQPSRDTTATVEVTLDPEVEAILEEEARRHHLSLEQIMRHAVFVCLADFDFGPGPGGGGAVSAGPSRLVGNSDEFRLN